MARVSPVAFIMAIAMMAGNLLMGCFRWRSLLVAYGAPHKPPLSRLCFLYLVGFFYNNFLPGAVGGDVVRGVVTKEAFGDRGMTSALTVVFVERVLGLAGLLCLSATALAFYPLNNIPDLTPWAALGLCGAAAAVGFVAAGRRFASHLPGRIGELAAQLPRIERRAPFLWALALSVAIHAVVALVGYIFLHAQSPGVRVEDALVIVPVAAATAFLPFTVGGAGAREAAFVLLCGAALHMDAPSAIAASLLLWASQLVLGAVGGVAQLIYPISPREAPESAA
jgi:uncharacterized membrane protein YbhN (UPF0104 family)